MNGRIKAAVAGGFTAAGFRTGNRNSRFVLDIVVTMIPAARNKYFNTRYTIDALLKDTQTGAEFFTYNTSSRESHPASQGDADLPREHRSRTKNRGRISRRITGLS